METRNQKNGARHAWRKRLSALSLGAAVALAVGLGSTSVRALEPRPTTNDLPPAQEQRGPTPGYAAGYGYAPSQVTDLPASELQILPMARAQAAVARWMIGQKQSELYRTVDWLYEDFENSPELRQANIAERDAHFAYTQARNSVLSKLWNDQNYRALRELSDGIRQQIEDERGEYAGKVPSPEQLNRLVALARVRLGYSSQASAMEAGALAADSGSRDAQRRLVAAGDRVAQLRHGFDRQVRRNPDFLAARRTVDDARTNYIFANAFAATAVDVAEASLRYAYYIHGADVYNNHNGYGYGGYGGYGYGGYGYSGVSPVVYSAGSSEQSGFSFQYRNR